MNNTNIQYLSKLIEPQIQSVCYQVQGDLYNHLQLDQETAHQVVMQTLRNIVGRDIRWGQSQPHPGRLKYQKTNYQNYRVYSDSDLSVPVAEIGIE